VRIPPLRDWPPSTHIAGVALAAALMLDVVAIIHTRGLDDEDPVIPLTLRTPPNIVIHLPNDAELIRAASNKGPFDLESRASDVVPFSAVVQQSAPAAVRPRLVGTVVQDRGSFVIVELSNGRMQVVRIGERAGELRLRSVNSGEAVFDDARGARVSLRTLVPGSESRP
jgi:hypothetical protein